MIVGVEDLSRNEMVGEFSVDLQFRRGRGWSPSISSFYDGGMYVDFTPVS